MKEIDPKDAVKGDIYLAWLSGFRVPSYCLIAKARKKDFWYREGDSSAPSFPSSAIGTLWELPYPNLFNASSDKQ